MDLYYVNDDPQSNGDHEVHKSGCYWLRKAKSTTPLGNHTNCRSAVRKAKQIYPDSNGCYYCSRPCNTS